jgi:hypothetical protein
MKKFLAILAVAGVMTACNNGTDETPVADSISQDSINAATTPVIVDSPATTTDSTVVVDSTKK